MGGGAMVVELERDADDIVALALEQGCDDGRIHAARHGDDDAGLRGIGRKVECVEHVSVQRRRSRRLTRVRVKALL